MQITYVSDTSGLLQLSWPDTIAPPIPGDYVQLPNENLPGQIVKQRWWNTQGELYLVLEQPPKPIPPPPPPAPRPATR